MVPRSAMAALQVAVCIGCGASTALDEGEAGPPRTDAGLRRDAGPMPFDAGMQPIDAGLDAGSDAGPIDAGFDAGPDAGPTCVPCPECAWEFEIVDPTLGPFGSLAAEPDGTLHVVYEEIAAVMEQSGPLKHAWRPPGGSWSIEIVDPEPSRYASLAIAADGTLHVAYQRFEPRALRYARRGPSGAPWTLTTVDSIVGRGTYPSLALAPDGVVHIAHFDREALEIHHSSLASDGSWSTERVVADTSAMPALAIRSDGTLHILYFLFTPSVAGIFDAEGRTGAWRLEQFAWVGSVGPYTRVAVGSDDTLYALYVDESFIDGVPSFATNPPGGPWTTRYLGGRCCNYGYHAGLDLDPDDGVHLSYWQLAGSDLHYAYRPPGGEFVFTVLATEGNVGQETSLVYAADHSVHITYVDVTNALLMHAERPGRCE